MKSKKLKAGQKVEKKWIRLNLFPIKNKKTANDLFKKYKSPFVLKRKIEKTKRGKFNAYVKHWRWK